MDSFQVSTRLTPALTQATVQKIINEVLLSRAGNDAAQTMSFAKETRDLLIECCVEFITMISTEANEIAEKDAKKTIACEHITKALQDLGFGEYVPEILGVAESFRTSQVVSTQTFYAVDQVVGELTICCRLAKRSSRRSSRAVCLRRSSRACKMSCSALPARSTMLVDRAS